MNTIDCIKSRRSVRKFTEEKVPHEVLEQLVELPEGMGVACLMPLGYPAEEPSAPKRKEVAELLTIK